MVFNGEESEVTYSWHSESTLLLGNSITKSKTSQRRLRWIRFQILLVWNQDTMLAALNNVSSDPDLLRILVSRDWKRQPFTTEAQIGDVETNSSKGEDTPDTGWSKPKRWKACKCWRTNIVGGNCTVQDLLHQPSHHPSSPYPPWDVCTRRTFIARRHSTAVRVWLKIPKYTYYVSHPLRLHHFPIAVDIV